jgi:ankyrin repeat protein
MIELKDYKKYKDSKALKEEISTTPLHLACKHSNYDAMRFLID